VKAYKTDIWTDLQTNSLPIKSQRFKITDTKTSHQTASRSSSI